MKLTSYQRVHFIGIGGCGMSALAKILLLQGYKVSGSDLKETPTTIRLRDMGATVHIGHDAKHMRLVDVVIISTAIPESNPEMAVAINDGLPVYRRAELLGFLMSGFKNRLSIAGTHGKTTTTGMMTQMLLTADQDPTYMIGGELMDRSGGGYLGKGDTFVAESDESDGSFLCLPATVAVLLNLEPEHMDYYKSEDKLNEAFSTFMSDVLSRDGQLIVNRDDENLMALVTPLKSDKIVTFGLSDQSDFWATDVQSSIEGVAFSVMKADKKLGEVSLSVYGEHNVYNALSVVVYGVVSGLAMDAIVRGLAAFAGTKRRFQPVGEAHGVSIYDDYAHHPTEIQATLEGVRAARNNRLVAIFQPHRYTRTRDFLEEFSACFDSADQVVITDVYAANESPIEGVNSEVIAEKLKARGVWVDYVPKKSEIPPFLLESLVPNDLVITMGAGDIHTVAKEIYVQLKSQERLNLKEMSH